MGLIKAAIGAAGGVLADQWKEFFYCDAIPNDILVVKGQKRITGRSSNVKGTNNIITNGSGIAVADGQCMIIVEQGKIVEFCAEPGEFTYSTSTEPSIFTGNLGDAILETFKAIGKRFTYGGDPGKDQRVYYFNTKEIMDNKFGTPNPIPFRVVDRRINFDVDVSIRCSGVYSYRIQNPILFYTNVCGNVEREYTRDEIDSQLKTEFISALQPAFAKIADLQIRPNELVGHTEELAQAMNEALTKKWLDIRGISVVSVALGTVDLPEEDREILQKAQSAYVYRDPTLAAGALVDAQSDAMRTAASNPNGAMMGFMGMGMAQQAGGMNAQNLYAMGMQQQQAQAQQAGTSQAPAGASLENTWTCTCGTQNKGKFCTNCANPRPASPSQWNCSCGTANTGKFCYNCGKPAPSAASFRCNKCGWVPENPAQPPKFCPECGDVFNENDKL
ncbi:MAG: SPFH domain-containing protein [Acetivibrionales bacterium]|jgi:membrane protease subunit (stomatin/prohibitin family)